MMIVFFFIQLVVAQSCDVLLSSNNSNINNNNNNNTIVVADSLSAALSMSAFQNRTFLLVCIRGGAYYEPDFLAIANTTISLASLTIQVN